MDLVITKCDVVLEDLIPLLQPNRLWPGSRLCRNEFLQVANGIILVALYPNLQRWISTNKGYVSTACVDRSMFAGPDGLAPSAAPLGDNSIPSKL